MSEKQLSLKHEILRKAFHTLGFIYILGLVYLQRPPFVLILAGISVLGIIIEILRLKNPEINKEMMSWFGPFVRESEKTKASGILWMTLGALTVAFLVQPVRLSVVVMLYLILGDAVASVVGKAVKGPRWGSSPKHISGSVACFAVCLGLGALLLRPGWGWNGIVLSSLLATVAEFGVFKVNDNLLIPLVSSLTFVFCYGLIPVFF